MNKRQRLVVLIGIVMVVCAVTAVAGGRSETPAPAPTAPEAPAAPTAAALKDPVQFRAEVLRSLGVPTDVYDDFAAAVAGPSERVRVQPARPIRIGFSSPSFDISDAWQRWYWSIHYRLEEAGIPFRMSIQGTSRHDSHDEQLAQIETLIASGVDYIIMGPTDLEAQHEAVRKVHAANIPLVILNFTRPIPWDKQTLLYVAFDHEFGGYLSGTHMAEYSGGKGNLAALRMIPGALDNQRWGGARSVIDQTDIRVVYETYAEANRQRAFEATLDIMTAHPDLNMIYATSSAMALGAAAALDSIGKAGTVGVWGFGGTVDEISAMRAGKMTGSVFRFQDDAGAAVGEAIKRYLEGRANAVPQVFMGDMTMAHSGMSLEQFRELANRAYRYTGARFGTGL